MVSREKDLLAYDNTTNNPFSTWLTSDDTSVVYQCVNHSPVLIMGLTLDEVAFEIHKA